MIVIASWSYSLTGMIDLVYLRVILAGLLIVIASWSYSLTGMIYLVYLRVVLTGLAH